MPEFELCIPTSESQMPVFVAHPHGKGPWPAILMLMDAKGVRSELERIARVYADWGFAVFLPDLYHRTGLFRPRLKTYDPAVGEAVEKMAMAAMNSVNASSALADAEATLQLISATSVASAGTVGCIGYCMSGSYAVAFSARHPDKIKASVSLFGTNIVTEDKNSPHRAALAIEGGLYMAFAETDPWVPPSTAATVTAALSSTKAEVDIETMPGTKHAFYFTDGKPYHPEASEHVDMKIRNLFDRHLRAQ